MADQQLWSELRPIVMDALQCSRCFQEGGFRVRRGEIRLAQIRWIGPNYRSSTPRISVVMINPGSGSNRTDGADRIHEAMLLRLRFDWQALDDILMHQQRDMGNWGKFEGFYFRDLRLQRDTTAFVNVAWCSASGNRYPSAMLEKCFDRHTRRFIRILRPQVVILSGSDTHRFGEQIGRDLPGTTIIRTLHYANRESRAKVESEGARVRALIAQARAPRR